MELYPDTLRRIAELCEGLAKLDGPLVPETDGLHLQLQVDIEVQDRDGRVIGVLNGDGGFWSFTAV